MCQKSCRPWLPSQRSSTAALVIPVAERERRNRRKFEVLNISWCCFTRNLLQAAQAVLKHSILTNYQFVSVSCEEAVYNATIPSRGVHDWETIDDIESSLRLRSAKILYSSINLAKSWSVFVCCSCFCLSESLIFFICSYFLTSKRFFNRTRQLYGIPALISHKVPML